MGVRISIYAFDAGPLRAFLEKPVSEVLQYYVKHGTASHSSIIVYDELRDGNFHASIEKGIIFNKNGLTPVSEEELLENPGLQRSAVQAFSADSDIALSMLLRCLSSCPEINFIKEITEGYRIWWVKSFLEHFERDLGFSPSDRKVVKNMLCRLISADGRSEQFQGAKEMLRAEGFPVVSMDVCDNISAWTNSEIEILLKVIRSLTEWGDARFRRPNGNIGIGPEKDEEWNEWVHKMLRQLFELEKICFRPLRTINFMG